MVFDVYPVISVRYFPILYDSRKHEYNKIAVSHPLQTKSREFIDSRIESIMHTKNLSKYVKILALLRLYKYREECLCIFISTRMYHFIFGKESGMKRFLFTPAAALLVAVVLFTSSCGGPNADGQVITCFGDIGVKVVASMISEDAPLTFASLLSVVPECINAAIAEFSSPSNSTPSSPEVDLNQSPNDTTASGSVDSNTWSNCTDYTRTLQFDFTVPFDMFVGGGDGSTQSVYSSSPSGSSDNDLIAQKVFQQYGGFIQSILMPNGEPSQSILQDVPPQMKITLTLPIQLSYRSGEARVVHTDGSTIELPWLFTDGYQQNGQISVNESSCLAG